MYKHSTTHRTLSRRLAALLAVLALLAALALPVYAETLDGATGTAQAEIGDTISNGTVTTENDSTTPEGKEAAEDSTANADGNNASENKKPDADNADGDNASENKKTDADVDDGSSDLEDADISDETKDTTSKDFSDNSESPEDVQQQDDGEAGDISLATESGEETFTIYFAAPSSWGNGDYQVYFNAQKVQYGEGDANYVNRLMEKIETLNYPDRNVYKVDLTDSTDCPNGHYNKLEFCKKETNKNDVWIQAFVGKWTDKSVFANSLYDYDGSTWKLVPNYQTFDRNNHKSFAGKTMFFQNQSNATLAKVQAVFYEKIDGSLQTVKTIDLGAIEAGKHASFTIPDKDCSYIQFVVDNKETPRYSFYGQQGEDAEGSYFLYDSSTAYCYAYKESDDGSSWTIPQGKITVYFDATFSSAYTENGDTLSIPKKGSKDVYCCFKNDSETTESVQMTPLENNLYSVEIPGGCSEIMFSGDNRTSPANSGASTDWVPIDWSLDEPCYMADTNDAVVYNNNASRGGYWKEKTAIRDAEAGKGTTVVDIDNTTSFVRDSATKYVTTTLYDYYTDWELNGNNRDDYKVDNGASQRNWVTFRQFDQALSDYYSNSGDTVLYPMYTGQFQPEAVGDDGKEWGFRFNDIADKLNLYGYNDKDKNKFMAVNNSTIDVDGKGLKSNEKKYYDDAFQGLAGDELVNGEPVLYNTKLTIPYFNKDFLEGANSKKAVLGKVYENVDFPFTKEDVFGNGINYWHYESNDKSLFLKQKKETADQYFLQQPATTVVEDKMVSNNAQNVNSSSTPSGTYGFFPFNEGSTDTHANTYNYGFGAKLQFDFTLTDDGQVLGNNGEKVPIQFFFSGDDDVWVYIDNVLALDVGGDHGKVSGLLEFGLNSDKKLVYTPYVSDVKASNRDRMYKKESNVKSVNYRVADKQYKQIPFNYKGDQKEISAGKHTLKFFYMERGMWESNMAIAFNFPDNNELEVEKQVDVDNVDGLFKPFFENVDSFDFTIRNLATHYGTKSASTLAETKILKVTQDTWTANPAGQNVCTWNAEAFSGTDAIHWYADIKDEGSIYRERRYGVIKPSSGQANISEMSYLSLEVYADTSVDTYLNLNDLYLELVDSSDKRKGSLGISGLAGKTYNGVSKLKANDWITIKLDLTKLTGDQDFNMTQLQTILIGDNYPVDLYIRNIQFTSKAAASTLVGFTTAQKDIPDYDTAIGNTTNEMKLAKGAQYTSSFGGSTQVVGEDGSFQLKNKEIVTFKDQFRRGSYISVTEDADPDLYETTWTIYENGQAVKNFGSGTTVTNPNPAISVESQRSYAPDDGRIEKTSAAIKLTDDQSNNSYNGEKPDGKAIVFRSYTNPDAGEAAELTKLKLQFVNKVKTGSITIKKLGDSTVSSGTFTFKVTYTNVGGQNLEDGAKVEGTYTVDVGGSNALTIGGIPIGTQFTIEEVPDAQGKTHLLSVAVENGDPAHVVGGKTVKGTVTKTDSASVTATFTNTLHDLMDIDLVKNWKNADGSDMTDDELKKMPDIIYVKLQRRVKAEPANKWVDVEYPSGSTLGYVAVKRGYTGWKCQFANLDATAWNLPGTPEYEYRVVEGTLVNNKFNPVDSNSMLVIGDNVYQVGSNTADKDNKTITLTNTLQDPKFKLDITKKDAENINNLLAGVGFTLEKMKDDGSGNLVVDSNFNTLTGVTNDNGELMVSQTKGFTNLEAGTYRLTETKAAKDYNLLSEPIIISFSKDGQCQVGNETPRHAEAGTIFTGDAAKGYTLSLTVLNRKTPALPHTGADAPSLWLLIGLPLAVAGLLILVFRYNKKGGRTR